MYDVRLRRPNICLKNYPPREMFFNIILRIILHRTKNIADLRRTDLTEWTADGVAKNFLGRFFREERIAVVRKLAESQVMSANMRVI